jgi:hypothetical protein
MRLYLALPDGAGSFMQDFTGPALLRIPARGIKKFTYRPFTFCGTAFQTVSIFLYSLTMQVLQPQPDCSDWFGLFRVRSPLLAESLLFSLPPLT